MVDKSARLGSVSPYSARFLITVGIALFAVGQAMPILVVGPLIREVGVSEVEFGLTFTLASIVLVFASPIWGRLSDQRGRRPFVLLGLTGAALGTLAIAVTMEAGLRGYLSGTALLLALGFSRFFYAGLAASIYPASSGYIADVTTEEQRGQGMALLGAANGVGAVIGPLLVATLAFVSVLFPMYVAVLLMTVAAAAMFLTLPEPARQSSHEPASQLLVTDARLRPYLIAWFMVFMVFMALQFVMAFFMEDQLGIEGSKNVAQAIAWVLVAMAVVVMLMQGLVFQLIKVDPGLLFKLSMPLFAVSLVMVAQSDSLIEVAIGFGAVGLAFSCAATGITGCASLSVGANEQGAAAGYLAAANTGGVIAGPLLGTALYSLGSGVPMYGGALLLGLMTLYVATVRTPRPVTQAV